MNTGAKILIIDDEKSIRRLLEINLVSNGYQVELAKNGKEGLQAVINFRPDVILLDLELPDLPGLEVAKKIRARASTPIIVITVKDAQLDKVSLLDAGADDYLTKPFNVEELLARIRVALRHSVNLKEEPIFECGIMKVDFNKRILEMDGEAVKLTNTEFDLIKVLIKNSGKIVTQSQLLREVWGPEAVNQSHYLRIYFSQLRKKLEKYAQAGLIVTEPGVGYRLNLDCLDK